MGNPKWFGICVGFGLMVASSVAMATNAFIYNPRSLQWTAISDQGHVVRTGQGSGGRSYCPDIHRSCRTPTGTYHVQSKGGPGCHSSRYPVGRGGAPMPYCMFFSKYYAIHGSSDVPRRNASHGCIRVRPSDARWLHQNFIKIGTTVVVKPY
jgi:lipoprotein-anchoring transpeptidase ErfK/SrfK